jgi:hypothetical protein
MPRMLLILAFLGLSLNSTAQPDKVQRFDGWDTSGFNSIFIILDTSASNVWQIGPPQKVIFDSAFNAPNVIVTDTINYYPMGANSGFMAYIKPQYWYYGIHAIRWMQKLDMDSAYDGGIVEYSIDSGQNWLNVVNNPYVYNFYGYDTANIDTLVSGDYAFSGTDSVWRDIWLCFDYSYFMSYDSVLFRFRFVSDSVDNQKEGWMIDNMRMHMTWVHTVAKTADQAYKMKVYPTNTSGRVFIEGEKIPEYYVIEHMQLISSDGKVVKQYGRAPVKFYIDINDQPDGMYYLKIETNKRTETFPILLKR